MKLRIVVTAGPTREWLDPVRFLSNPSSGRMGFAIAEAAARRGHDTTLVAGPVSLATPSGVKRIDVETAREMAATVRAALRGGVPTATVLVAAAAVADWRPARRAAKKLKKTAMSGVLRLVRNPDVLASARGCRKVGFAAETGDPEKEALRKMREKSLEAIVANDVSEPGSGFGTATNRATLYRRDGTHVAFPPMSKKALAARIIAEIEKGPAPIA